jgi:hypothetical protein
LKTGERKKNGTLKKEIKKEKTEIKRDERRQKDLQIQTKQIFFFKSNFSFIHDLSLSLSLSPSLSNFVLNI